MSNHSLTIQKSNPHTLQEFMRTNNWGRLLTTQFAITTGFLLAQFGVIVAVISGAIQENHAITRGFFISSSILMMTFVVVIVVSLRLVISDLGFKIHQWFKLNDEWTIIHKRSLIFLSNRLRNIAVSLASFTILLMMLCFHAIVVLDGLQDYIWQGITLLFE